MKYQWVVLGLCFELLAASPSFADARSDAKSQVDFGINVAQRGLWREAIYRWEKAVELDPTSTASQSTRRTCRSLSRAAATATTPDASPNAATTAWPTRYGIRRRANAAA